MIAQNVVIQYQALTGPILVPETPVVVVVVPELSWAPNYPSYFPAKRLLTSQQQAAAYVRYIDSPFLAWQPSYPNYIWRRRPINLGHPWALGIPPILDPTFTGPCLQIWDETSRLPGADYGTMRMPGALYSTSSIPGADFSVARSPGATDETSAIPGPNWEGYEIP